MVYVICCNDSLERAVIGDEGKADELRDRLRNEHYERHRWRYPDFARYCQIFFWHVHAVPVAQ